jgi:hypothetical protein
MSGGLSAHAGTIWYNGDFNGANGLANEIGGEFSPAAVVYDDFVLSSTTTINYAWSNNQMDPTSITSADWEIRSGMSSGNGGTLLFSGTSAATQTATGRSAFGRNEYTVMVSGLNITLGPGTYWLAVAPVVTDGVSGSFVSTTSGLNSIGTPPGNDDNSFLNAPGFGLSFVPASDEVGAPADFSMGIGNGRVTTPEPSQTVAFGVGLFGLVGLIAIARRRAAIKQS